MIMMVMVVMVVIVMVIMVIGIYSVCDHALLTRAIPPPCVCVCVRGTPSFGSRPD